MIGAINHWPFIVGSWLIAGGVLGGYAVNTVRRGKRLSQQVPPERRRWM